MSAIASLGVAPGRSDDDRTRISRGILLMLEGLTRRQGGYLESLDHYRGELSGDQDQAMSRLRGRAPAVLVTVGSSSPESRSSTKRSYMYKYQVELAIISMHMDSLESREVGGADRFMANADPGIGKMMHDVRGKLAGRKLNVEGCGTLIPEGESVISDGDMAIFASRFTVSMAFNQARSSDPTPNIASSSDTTHNLIVEESE